MKAELSILTLRSPFLEHLEGSDLMWRPHEWEKLGHLGFSVSPSDILVKERFSYNDLLHFQKIFRSKKEAGKG